MKSFTITGLLQAVRWHRWGIALLALFAAVLTGLSALMPHQSPGTAVVVAARALPPGAVLASADLTIANLPDEAVPDGAFTDIAELLGRPLCVGLSRGTPITTTALTADAWVDHDAGEVLVPFRVRDPDVAALLRVGDKVTIVTSTPEGVVQTIAEHVRVAQLPLPTGGGLLNGGTSSGALIVVAAPRELASQLAAASDQWLGVVIE